MNNIRFLILGVGCWAFTQYASAQKISDRLQKAYRRFEADSQLHHAISSLYVIDAATGKVVFDKNSQVGLAGASTQKIITAATAFELLGKDFQFTTRFQATKDGIFIYPSGDPTLGTWRYAGLREKFVDMIVESLQRNNIKKVQGDIYISDYKFNLNPIPGGWIWDDIGNYYGAGAQGFNWGENQYDISFKSAGEAEQVAITKRDFIDSSFINEVRAGKPGSGDNAYIYYYPNSTFRFIQGTIPPRQEKFTISGSFFNPAQVFGKLLLSKMKIAEISFDGKIKTSLDYKISGSKLPSYFGTDNTYTYSSPKLDSIIYWFLKKSVNLYGEALIKTFSYQQQDYGSTDSGVAIVRRFWKEKGLDDEELNIYDGSGLSPLNRITTHAQVEILKYATRQDWFPYFYDALPEFNGMKMKSGTISDVKAYCGYQKSKDGRDYIFSFIVNNYSGRSSSLINKMYKVLDELK
jgi:serine-type D-Ala-D-Ala carboxypeptidase/endopeptidase (penicillin-binding protein 4)